MFIMRTKKNAAVINDAQQEPSSPKVTCIGQVRARRSSKAKNSKSKRPSRSATPPKQVLPHHPCSCSCSCSSACCCCVPRTHFCCHFSTPRFRKPRSFCRPFRKWVTFFRFGYCKKIDTRDDCSSRVESIPRGQNHVNSITSNTSDIEDNKETVGETKEDESSSSPPKNALLLTRCRSAPYRSSSLAGRFWGSPLRTSETETEKSPKKELQEPRGGEMERPISPNYGNEAVESRNSSSHEGSGSQELDSSSNGRTIEANIQDMSAIGIGGGGGSIHPLLLIRCKSEPARTGERLNPEVNFWRQRRSDTTESCLQESSNCD